MPHVTLEHSDNIDGPSMAALCDAVLDAVLKTGTFETGAVRVRAIRCEAYAIADRDPRNAFVDGSLRMGRGRDLDTRKAVGEAIFATMCAFFSDRFDTDHFALSFEVREINPELSFKKNSMHRRFRAEND